MWIARTSQAKDRYAKDVYGTGCIGNVTKAGHEQEYNIWRNMISRCYNKKDKSYKFYGGRNVTVSERWKCFEYFFNDISKVEGFNKKEFLKGTIELDKDKKSSSGKTKLYSLSTCCFTDKKENIRMGYTTNIDRNHPKYIVKVTKEDGSQEITKNIPEYCRENGLQHSKISLCINGKRNTHHGWKFEKIGENQW